jgi:hypothetical protein
MISTLARVRALSGAERRLIVEAVAALALAAFTIATLPFRRVVRLSAPPIDAAVDHGDQSRSIDKVRWAVSACARRVPWRAKCLEQAVAAQWMLRRRSVPAAIHYGVARHNGGLAAHAWVRAGSLDVLGCETAGDFRELARFPVDRS